MTCSATTHTTDCCFHYNNGYANVPQCYVMHTLPVLLHFAFHNLSWLKPKRVKKYWMLMVCLCTFYGVTVDQCSQNFIYICVCVCVCMCVYVCARACIYIYIYICVCVCVYIYIYNVCDDVCLRRSCCLCGDTRDEFAKYWVRILRRGECSVSGLGCLWSVECL